MAYSSSKGSDGVSLEDLRCAVCLENYLYKHPRELACWHIFCEECIQSCIAKEAEQGQVTGINCPVCRTSTTPEDPSKPSGEWAKELPENGTVLQWLKILLRMDQEKGIYCDNCTIKKKSNVVAMSFCKECQQHLCSPCISKHEALSSLSGHNIVSLKDKGSYLLAYPIHGRQADCPAHKDKAVEFFCEYHNSLFCSTCAFLNHRRCTAVHEVRKLGRKVKDDEALHLMSKMAVLQVSLTATAQEIRGNKTEIDTQTDTLPRTVMEMRKDVMSTLDKLVRYVNDSCAQVKKQHSAWTEERKSRIESLTAAIMSSCSVLDSVLKHGSDSQVFIAYMGVQKQYQQYEQSMKEICSNVRIHTLHSELVCKLQKVHALMRTLLDEPINKIRVVRMVDCSIEKQALLSVEKRDGRRNPWYSGIVCLSDGRVVVTDRLNKLCCLLDETFDVIADVKLPGEPSNLAVVGDCQVAVCIPLAHKSLLRIRVDQHDLKIVGEIPNRGRAPRCVSCISDTELAVGWDNGFSIITMDGKEKNYLSKESSGRLIRFSNGSRFVVDVKRAHVVQACAETETVYCFGLNGESVFRYKQIDKPRGLSVDKDSNIYVCNFCSEQNSVHQIDPSGKQIRIIATEMNQLYTLCFNEVGNQIILLNYGTDQAMRIDFVSPN